MGRSEMGRLCEEVERVMLAVPEVCSDPPCGVISCRAPHYGDFNAMAGAAVEAVLKWVGHTSPIVGRAGSVDSGHDPQGASGPMGRR